MDIILILPRSKLYQKGRGFRKNLLYAPLTLTTLAALIPDELNANVRIIDEAVELVDYSKLNADLIGITCITGTANRAYDIADNFRKRDITVIIGGPHPSLIPEEAKKHADSVIVGIANNSWPQLLKDFKQNKLKDFYNDTSGDITNMPIPKRELLKKKGYFIKDTVQAVYGCPYECEFCIVKKIRGGYFHRPIPEVIKEIKDLNTKLVLFLDSSPIEDKDYIKEFYRALIPLKIRWAGLSTTKIIEDKELFDLAVKSGCSGLLIGFESISQKSLNKMNKSFNHVEKYEELIKELHKHNIAIMGCFTFGSDEDEKVIFKETVDFVNKNGIDLPRYTVTTPFPATPLFDRLKKENRILTKNWDKYNAQNVVFQPKNMSVNELQKGLEYAWKETYKWKNILKRILKSKSQLGYLLVANMGYRRYANEQPHLR